ncbi:hypothetical protein SY88_17035 [Clostridiales bacterium PH28_bin88]|nr:hypothetical protein SY88_17035 [Clostridiales bacterium PH28_bin88]
MEKVDLVKRWRDINYFGPVYGQHGGNCTEFLFTKGERVIDPRRTKTVLAALARVFSRDLVALRENCGRELGRRQAVPLLLDQEMVLIPVKARGGVDKDQGTTGYAVLGKVAAVEPAAGEGNRSVTVFADGTRITTLYSLNTLRSRVQQGKLLTGGYPFTQGVYSQLLREPPELAPGRVVYLLQLAEGVPMAPLLPFVSRRVPGVRKTGISHRLTGGGTQISRRLSGDGNRENQ